jgi:pimeloyl-ACP methyl ester carboxylesterase
VKRSCPHVIVLVAALVAAVLGIVPTATARSQGGSAPHPTGAGEAVELSVWQECSDPFLDSYGLECARLRVPLDYAHPDRGTISLAVTRRAHDPDAGDYQGVLVTSPGGPGGSGTWMPALADYVPQGAGDTYDWIGLDPRGVGASQPALHCEVRHLRHDRPGYVPANRAEERSWLHRTGHYARSCGDSAGARLLPFMTTLDNVRDLESLRAALAEEQPEAGSRLNFYGYDYGSYLGEVYASRYPQRVGRFVLDGVVNPDRVWYRAHRDRARALQRNLAAWFRYLADHSDAFGLGGDWRELRAEHRALLRRLEDRPAARGRLGPDELTDVLLRVGFSATEWLPLGRAYADLVLDGDARALLQEYRSGRGNDTYAVHSAVQCTDASWPSWARQRRAARADDQRAPYLRWAGTWYDAPCRAWPTRSHEPVTVRDEGIGGSILLVNETRDAVTPYAGAVRVRELFPTARLIAGTGTTHGASLSGVACVDDAIADYLRDGTTPPRRPVRGADLTCPGLAPEEPFGDSTPRGLPASLRARLFQAQHPLP